MEISSDMEISEVGSWSVHSGRVVSPEGVTKVTVLNDGEHELVTAKDPAELLVALMQHLGVDRVDRIEGK
jgi:hypothetical protein